MLRKERKYASFEELETQSQRIVSLKDYITKRNARILNYGRTSDPSVSVVKNDGSLERLLRDNEERLSKELEQDAVAEMQEEARRMEKNAREAEIALEARKRESRLKEQEKQRMKELQVKARHDWFRENGWMDNQNKTLLDQIGAHLNSERERLIKLEERLLRLKKRVKLKGEAYELLYKSNEHGETDKPARPAFNLGGDAKAPKMFVLSYPGLERDLLFRILRSMHLDLGEEGEVHCMNDQQKESGYTEEALPQQWFELFNRNRWYKQFLMFLRQDIQSKEYRAPAWFINNWAKAALNAAAESSISGAGIIILKSWSGYEASPWCEMEYHFCKAVASVFPRSVYVVTGYDGELNMSIGHYLDPQ